MDLYFYDENCREMLGSPLCGVDEAGRGPLAGPVVAAAVILPSNARFEGLNDSKKLSEKTRERLFDQITAQAIAYRIEAVGPDVVDEVNILQATLLAMSRALEGLCVKPGLVLVDGDRLPKLPSLAKGRRVIKGDSISASIAAASVLAKVTRDRMMKELALQYPEYGFEKHKGYPTKAHYEAIFAHGVSPVHRLSFLKNLEKRKNPPPPAPTQKQILGDFGERAALAYLQEHGYTLIEKNYRRPCGEIDLIVEKEGTFSIVEVKSRTGASYGRPIDAVNYRKRQRIIRATVDYFSSHQGRPIRFDVVEVYLTTQGGTPQVLDIKHLKHVFCYDIYTLQPIAYH